MDFRLVLTGLLVLSTSGLQAVYVQAQHNNFTFTKDYQDVCEQWLGGAPPRRAPSDVKKHLGGLLGPLVERGLIRNKWSCNTNTSDDGFNLVLRPGNGFFEDYDKFYGHQQVIAFDEARKLVEETPVLVAQLWQHAQEKVFGRSDTSGIDMTKTERDYMGKLVKKYGYDVAALFIAFAAKELPRTGFDQKIATLNGPVYI